MKPRVIVIPFDLLEQIPFGVLPGKKFPVLGKNDQQMTVKQLARVLYPAISLGRPILPHHRSCSQLLGPYGGPKDRCGTPCRAGDRPIQHWDVAVNAFGFRLRFSPIRPQNSDHLELNHFCPRQ